MQEKEPASDSRLNKMVLRSCRAKDQAPQCQCQVKTGLLREQQLGKETQEEIPEQWKRNEQRQTNWRLCSMDLERSLFTRRFVQVQARVTQITRMEKKEIAFYFRNENTRERRRNRQHQRKVPEGTSPSGKSHHCKKRSNARENPHVLSGNHQNAHTTNPKVYAKRDIRVYSNTQAKLVKTKVVVQLLPCIQLEETKELNCVLEDGQGDTLTARPIPKKIGWPPTKKQFRVRYCRNAERHFCTGDRKGLSLGFNQWSRKNDRNPNAPTQNDSHQLWTQHWEEKPRIAAWRLIKSDPTHEEQETIRKSKESSTIITANGSITTTEEAAVPLQRFGHAHHRSIVGRFIILSLGKHVKNMGLPTNRRLQVGKFVYRRSYLE